MVKELEVGISLSDGMKKMKKSKKVRMKLKKVVGGGVGFVVMKWKGDDGVVDLKRKFSVVGGDSVGGEVDVVGVKKWNWKKWKKGSCSVEVVEVVEKESDEFEGEVVVVFLVKWWEVMKFLSFFDKVSLV